ncbi:MAG: hypothetical protein K6G30_04130, partial [Acetatifactor sp.]|nr:hypothetical protein [Acetatifactor sp.]
MIDNDNIYLKTIASGEMTGAPEPHLYYMGILSGLVLSTLYRLTGNGIPWFGIFLCASVAVPMVLLLNTVLKTCEKIWQYVIAYLLCILVFCSFFYQYFAKTQFTVATGVVGVGALFYLATLRTEDKIGNYLVSAIPFLLLTAWSFGMRDKGFLMLIPFLGMTFLSKLTWDKQWKKNGNVVLLGIVFVALIATIYGGNRLAYSSDEWKEFKEYTDASEILFDYNGFPAYETHRDLYHELGITESSYKAIIGHYNILLDPAINRDAMVRLAQVAEEERIAAAPALPEKIVSVLKDIVQRNLFDYVDRPLNVLVFFLYAFVVILALLKREWMALRDVAFLVIARMTDWIYLVWFGRYPFRVTQIIYLAELVCLVAVLINYELWANRKAFTAMLVGIVFLSFRFGFPVMRNANAQIKDFRAMSVCFPELEEYLEVHSDNFYYFDMSHLYYMEDTLAFEPSDYENYVYMGSWMPN